MDQVATQMSSSFANLASAMRVDASAFAHAIHFNMDAEDLSSLMMSYAKASKLTYDNNLTTLGYADEADPISVKIFPRDFEAKERVLDHIDAYNKHCLLYTSLFKAVKPVVQVVLLIVGIAMVCFGVMRSEADAVLAKAIRLCLECIGCLLYTSDCSPAT